jgi:hypothetical protein
MNYFLLLLFILFSSSSTGQELKLPHPSVSRPEIFYNFTSQQLVRSQQYFSSHEDFLKKNLDLIKDLDGYITYLKFSKVHVDFPNNAFFDLALRDFFKGFTKSLEQSSEELSKLKLNKEASKVLQDFEKECGIAAFIVEYITGLNQTFFIAINKRSKENAVFTKVEYEAILENIQKNAKAQVEQNVLQRLHLALNELPEAHRYEFMRLMTKLEYKNAFYSYFDHQKRFIYKVLKIDDAH